MTYRTPIAALLALSLTGCLGLFDDAPVVHTPPARCSEMIPTSWSEGVDGAPIPADQSALIASLIGEPLTEQMAALIVGPWAAAYVAADGQTEKANGRTSDTIEIVRRCEELVNDARPD